MKAYQNTQSSYIGQLYRERDYRRHIQRMNDIFQGKTLKNKYLTDNHKENKDLLAQNRWKARQRSEGARLFQIQRENDGLLDRLVKISTRDPHIADNATSRIDESRLDRSHLSSLFDNGRVMSLNFVERKLAAKKIDAENESLSERILLKKSELSKKRLEVDYTKHQKIADRLRKVELPDNFTRSQTVKRGKDGRILSKSRILPPLPQAIYHRKFLGEDRSDASLSYREHGEERVRIGRNASLADLSHRRDPEFSEVEKKMNKSSSNVLLENLNQDPSKDHEEKNGQE